MNGIEVERDLRARWVPALAEKPARRSGSTTAEASVVNPSAFRHSTSHWTRHSQMYNYAK